MLTDRSNIEMMTVDKRKERKKILDAVTRQDIIDAVAATLISEGTQGFTMDKVATKAGVAKGTLYTHFKSKEEAIEVTMDSIIEPLSVTLDTIVSSDLTPAEKLTKYTSLHFAFFDDHQDLFRVILYDREQAHAPKERFQNNRYWQFVKKLAGIIEDGVNRGEFIPLPPLKISSMFIEANIALVMQRLANKVTGNIVEDVELVMKVFLRGILLNPDAKQKEV